MAYTNSSALTNGSVRPLAGATVPRHTGSRESHDAATIHMITKLTDSWNIGQFNLALSADVEKELLKALMPLILRWLGQRNSAVDKVLGAYETNGDGKQVRKAGWKRTDVDYSEEMARELETAFSELSIPDDISGGKDVKLAAVAVVGQKVETGAAPKFTEEKAIITRHTADLTVWAKDTVKFAGAVDAANPSDDFLKAVQAYKKAALKGL